MGISHRDSKSEAEAMAKLTDEQLSFTALVNGKRGLFHNSTFFTHFCYSNPKARKMLVDFCVEYVQKKPHIDFLHIWLADSVNNQCECENCVKMTPSDHFVVLLNEIEAAFEKINARTRLVFIMYNDTVRPPETQRLKHPERFTIVTAIGQLYETGYIVDEYKGELPPFERNKYKAPSIPLRLLYHKQWKEICNNIPSFIFEYRFYTDQYNDPGDMRIARETYRDMRSLKNVSMQGCINDQTHRMYMPTSLPLLLMGETLFDSSIDFDTFANDYFVSAFGKDGMLVREYLEKLSENFCVSNVRNYKLLAIGEEALTLDGSPHESFINNPNTAKKFALIPDILDKFMPVIKKNMAMDEASQRLSWTYLYYHSLICKTLSNIFLLASQNKMDEAKALLEKFETELSFTYKQPICACIGNMMYLWHIEFFLFIKSVREKLGIKMCKYFE